MIGQPKKTIPWRVACAHPCPGTYMFISPGRPRLWVTHSDMTPSKTLFWKESFRNEFIPIVATNFGSTLHSRNELIPASSSSFQSFPNSKVPNPTPSTPHSLCNITYGSCHKCVEILTGPCQGEATRCAVGKHLYIVILQKSNLALHPREQWEK